VDGRDLRGDELDPVVVELLAEPELVRAALREAGDDDPRGVRGAADRLAERGGRAGQVDRDVGASARGRVLDRVAGARLGGVDRRRAEPCGKVEATGDAIDREDVGAAQERQLRRDQAGNAEAEDRDRLADVDVRVEDRVQRDRADAREDAAERRQVVEDAAGDRLLGDDGRAAVAPDSPDPVARTQPRRPGPHLHDLADLLVAPVVERVLEGRSLDEDAPPGVPALRHIRVRAAVGRELRAGRDAGVQRAHPDLAGLRGPLLVLDDRDLPRRAERDAALRHSQPPRSAAAARATAAWDSGSRLIEKKPWAIPP
jgi:hypothetical protein